MARMIFVNLPVRDLARSLAFRRAAAAGGLADPNPAQDHGFMFTRTLENPDGNVREVMWIDPRAVPAKGVTLGPRRE